jgi:hypothetical protein
MTWYVVFRGYKTGVFSNWRECHARVIEDVINSQVTTRSLQIKINQNVV